MRVGMRVKKCYCMNWVEIECVDMLIIGLQRDSEWKDERARNHSTLESKIQSNKSS